MSYTGVLRILSERPELRDGGYFLLRADKSGLFVEKIPLSAITEKYLQKHTDCDFMIVWKQ